MSAATIGHPIPSSELHRALCENGYGCLVVVRGEYVEYAACWPETPNTAAPCHCTDYARNQPREKCPDCGEAEQ